jgi:hypothetical protein
MIATEEPTAADGPQLVGQVRKYLSPREYSTLTGLSMATVQRRLSTKQIPFFQPGGRRSRVLIPVDALQAQAEETGPEPSTNGSAGPQTVRDPKPAIKKQSHLPGPQPRWMNKPNFTNGDKYNAKTPKV